MPAAHEPLDRIDGTRRVGHGLPLGRLADQGLPLGREGDDRRRQPAPLLVGDDRDVAAFHHRDHAVRRPEVDPNDLFTFCHDLSPFNPILEFGADEGAETEPKPSLDGLDPCRNSRDPQAPRRSVRPSPNLADRSFPHQCNASASAEAEAILWLQLACSQRLQSNGIHAESDPP